MKAILSIFYVLFALNAIGQQNKMNFRDPIDFGWESKPKKPLEHQPKATLLYSNDFSNTAQWSFSNTSTPSADWQITTNLNAAPFATFHPAGFASGFNGYGIIDSDAQGGTAAQDAYISLIPRITTCETEPFVVLQFSQMYRRFNDTTSVEVSNNGNNWTEFLVNGTIPNSVNSSNPETVIVNISSVAGNQDSVYIRFRYRASDAWFWAIDDVKIFTQDEFDLVGEKINFGSIGNWGLQLPYTQIPLSQIQPIAMEGKVRNAGFGFQTDVQILGSGTSYTGASALDGIPPNLSAIYPILPDWIPTAALGQQSLNFTVQSPVLDEVPANNDLQNLNIEITSYLYSRDELIREGRVSNGAYTIGFETGNIFDIYSNAEITSALVHVANESAANTKLFAKLYEANGINDFILLAGSDTLVLPNLSQDSLFRVRLKNPVSLLSGKSYLLVAGSPGSPAFPGLVIGTAGIADIFTAFYTTTNATSWSNFTERPMVRMNFEPVLTIPEIGENVFQMITFPNPLNDQLNIEFTLQNPQAIQLEIYDNQGRMIVEKREQGVLGRNKLMVDTADLYEGHYILKIASLKDSQVRNIVKIQLY
ncbi:MAG: T9SS type A sorting domain-containing protein [Crocinitomicaceae bacterium]